MSDKTPSSSDDAILTGHGSYVNRDNSNHLPFRLKLNIESNKDIRLIVYKKHTINLISLKRNNSKLQLFNLLRRKHLGKKIN